MVRGMRLEPDDCYAALVAHDARFDGVFFVGVKTTGIYCRPVCRARTPGRDRCVFFGTAGEAEWAGFRACLRCRPELAPGMAPVDAVARVAGAARRRIEGDGLEEGTLAGLARGLGVSPRQMRRAVRAQAGVPPVKLAQARRLARARQLITGTGMRVTDVAFASGFRSLRRFNAAFRERYGCAPSQLRLQQRPGATP